MNLPGEIYSVANVRKIDKAAIDSGISGYVLMTRAAQAAMQEIEARYPQAKRWQVLCGAGNNGGDGYVLARLAGQKGIAVSALALSNPEELQGDAGTAYMDFAAEGGVVGMWEGTIDAEADLLVDAMLGSGLERDVEGEYAAAVDALNDHPASVCALDIPTGLHGDTGDVLGTAVRADLTVTFVGLKKGLLVGEGPAHRGELAFADLDIPEQCKSGIVPEVRRIDDAAVAAALPRRDRAAHKGDFGHVLLVGGGPGMPGAIRLCGEGALRAGAGRVSVATHPSHAAQIAASRPELMCHGVEGEADLEKLLQRVDTIGIGPGLGEDGWARALFTAALGSKLPAVIDADALNLLATTKGRRGSWILTPHPGEECVTCASRGAAWSCSRALER
jgi:NAD(P)H-hydrate epimerase